MKNPFYTLFNIEDSNIISVAGGGDNTALIHILAKESVARGFRPLVIGFQKQKYPIEGKVLISDETELLLKLIRSDEPEVTYLARKIEADLLVPFTQKELSLLIKQLNGDVKIFINMDHKNIKSATYKKIFKDSMEICTINFNILRQHLLEIYQNTAIKSSKSAQKKIEKYFAELLEDLCPNYASLPDKERHVLFIDQVKNVLDENLLIPVARNLQRINTSKILYGYVHHYNLKEIK